MKKEDLIKLVKKMSPGDVMRFVADELGTSPAEMLAKNAGSIALQAVKSGWAKAGDIKDAVKNFSQKSSEDSTGIDWDNVEVDESGFRMSCLFDGDSGKRLKEFVKKLSSRMKEFAKDSGGEDDVDESARLLFETKLMKDMFSKDAVAAIVKAAKNGGRFKAGDSYVRKSGDTLARYILQQDFPDEYEAMKDVSSNARKAAISRLGMIARAAAKGDSKILGDTLKAAGLSSYANDILGNVVDDAANDAVDKVSSKAAEMAAKKLARLANGSNMNVAAATPYLASALGTDTNSLEDALFGRGIQANFRRGEFNAAWQTLLKGRESDPEAAVKKFMDATKKFGSGPDASAEIVAKVFPDLKDELKDLGYDVNGKIDAAAEKAVSAAKTVDDISSAADAAGDPKEAVAAAGGAKDAAKEMSGDEEMKKEVAEKTGVKAFTPLGWARLAAKTSGYVLNHGKDVVDALGAKKIAKAEDSGVVAEIRTQLENVEGSGEDYSDSLFSVRFSADDFKWHATCLDDRKMKFPEDKLVEKVLGTETGRKFKEYCLKKWRSMFGADEGGDYAMLPFILRNIDKFGLKVADVKGFGVVRKMAENMDKIEAEFK